MAVWAVKLYVISKGEGGYKMDNNSIRKTWNQMDKLFGPSFMSKIQRWKYCSNIFKPSIRCLWQRKNKGNWKEHLKLVAEKMLDGEQFPTFLRHVIQYERFLR